MKTLTCSEARELLGAYIDGELDAPTALALEHHLRECAECRAQVEARRALSAAVRRAPYHRAPDTLRARIARPVAAPGAAPAAVASPRPRARDWQRWSLPIAAALVLALSLNFAMETRRAGAALTDELVAAHVRSLQVGHLADVPSSDRHTVKPWFNGKLDYSPPVRDLAAQDFPLIGGRLDYIDHREVAALVYRHRQHTINVFVWPAGDAPAASPVASSRDGYNLLRWTGVGMHWSAVSDLNAAELREFVDKLCTQVKAGEA